MDSIWTIIPCYAILSQVVWEYMLHVPCPAHPIHLCAGLCSSHRRRNRHVAKEAPV